MIAVGRRGRRSGGRRRKGQALVEYMLAVSVLAIAMAVGFIYLSDSTCGSFRNTRLTVQQVYP